MARALVFINSISNSPDLVRDLAKLEGVSEVHNSRGLYDAVVMVHAESFSRVKEIVSEQIRNMDNVKSTLTLTLIETPVN